MPCQVYYAKPTRIRLLESLTKGMLNVPSLDSVLSLIGIALRGELAVFR